MRKNDKFISKDGIDIIKEFEGFSANTYLCPGGYKTIGYGHRIKTDMKPITEEQAEKLLLADLLIPQNYINNNVKVPLTQGQFDALCSLIFNWGCKNFGNSKGLKFLQKKEYIKAAIEFFSKEKGIVNIQGKFSNGLYRRRQVEFSLWLGENINQQKLF